MLLGRYHWIILALFFLAGNACQKDEPTLEELQKEEESRIEKYIIEKNYTIDTTFESGLRYMELKEGTGETPDENDTVFIDFISWDTKDYVFDTTIKAVADTIPHLKDEQRQYGPIWFVIGENMVFKGLEDGVQVMKDGGEAILIIPSSLAAEDFNPLIYQVYLMGVKKVE